MAQTNIQILSTRPLNKEIILEAKEKNINIDVESFISIEFIQNSALSQKIKNISTENIIAVFTSMNAVDAVKKITTAINWRIYSIGNTTEKLINNTFGKERLKATANNAYDLAQEIIMKEESGQTVHFFCSDLRRNELPAELVRADFEVAEHTVYKTILTSKPLKKKYDAILFYSPSAVKSYFELNEAHEGQIFFAIGKTTAEAIKQNTLETVITADKPGKTELAELMLNYFQNKPLTK
jgi:uroporphyrinogen-III synthase